jgi:hypothetical protein
MKEGPGKPHEPGPQHAQLGVMGEVNHLVVIRHVALSIAGSPSPIRAELPTTRGVGFSSVAVPSPVRFR